MRKGMSLLTVLAVFSGCGSETDISTYTGEMAGQSSTSVSYFSGFAQSDESFDNECTVTLGETVSIQGAGAWFEDGCLSVTEGGVYNLSGVLADGMIYIDSDEPVRLVLNGISVVNSEGAAVFCENGALSVEAATGTENYFTDGEYTYSREFESESKKIPSAAFFTGGDLEFCGGGSVTVTSLTKTGIFADSELTVSGGSVYIDTASSGLGSNGGVNITGGSVVIFGGNSDIGEINVSGGIYLAFGDIETEVPPNGSRLVSRSLDAQAGETVAITDGDDVIISAVLPKKARGVVFSNGSDCSRLRLFKGGKEISWRYTS